GPCIETSGFDETDMPKYLGDVRCWFNSGKHVLALSFSGFVQGFGCRPSTAVQRSPAAGVRKPPRNEPAGIVQRGCRALHYGDLSYAISVRAGARSRWRRLMSLADSSSSACWSRLSLRVAVAGWVR